MVDITPCLTETIRRIGFAWRRLLGDFWFFVGDSRRIAESADLWIEPQQALPDLIHLLRLRQLWHAEGASIRSAIQIDSDQQTGQGRYR